jgi:hypothetical protein
LPEIVDSTNKNKTIGEGEIIVYMDLDYYYSDNVIIILHFQKKINNLCVEGILVFS